MFGQLETLYQDVTAARGIWTASHAGGSSAGAAWDAACHKMELGMLSRQEYLEAQIPLAGGNGGKGEGGYPFPAFHGYI